MTLYQILDETNYRVNEFNQIGMAKCHLDVVKQLSPEHHYRINKENIEKTRNELNTAANLIINFG
jgi:hypothetical protein